VISFLAPMIVISVLYGRIAITLRRSARQLSRRAGSSRNPTQGSAGSHAEGPSSSRANQHSSERRAALKMLCMYIKPAI